MSTVQNRQPWGASDGGQFAASLNPESTLDLGCLEVPDDAPTGGDTFLVLGEPAHGRVRQPYEVLYGRKYEETKNLGTAELAGLMRADIKAAVARGDLPKDATISVTSERFAGGSAINIEISNWPGGTVPTDDALCVASDPRVVTWCKPGRHEGHCPAAAHRSEAGETARKTIQAIHDSYNYDGSDAMTDYFHVRYYGQAKVEEYRAPFTDPALAPLRKTGSMADLKRTIKVGTVLEVVQNPNWPESVGSIRPVSKAQTGSFAMLTRKTGTDRDVNSWMEFGKASELTFDKDAGEFQIGDVRFKIVGE